jgi:prolyl-tRNA synthetase
VAELLGVPLVTTVKSLVLATDETNAAGEIVKTQVWLLLLRGDHDMNEIKVARCRGWRASASPPWREIEEHFGCKPGYLGPIGLKKPVKIVADREVALMADWICGANEADFHTTGVNWGRDLPEPDACGRSAQCGGGRPLAGRPGVLAIERGIEVGHVFYLGTKYSRAMNATFLDENGKPQPLLRDGLLRHRHHPPACCCHRAEPRRARHHLARRDCAVHRGDLPRGHGPQRSGQGRGRVAVCRFAGATAWT